jgi:hypothetical protein
MPLPWISLCWFVLRFLIDPINCRPTSTSVIVINHKAGDDFTIFIDFSRSMPSPADLLRAGKCTGALTYPAADGERKLRVRLSKRGRGLFAVEGFQRNQVITTVEGRVEDSCDKRVSDEVHALDYAHPRARVMSFSRYGTYQRTKSLLWTTVCWILEEGSASLPTQLVVQASSLFCCLLMCLLLS